MDVEIDELSVSGCPLKKDCCIEYGETCPHFVEVANGWQVVCEINEDDGEEE